MPPTPFVRRPESNLLFPSRNTFQPKVGKPPSQEEGRVRKKGMPCSYNTRPPTPNCRGNQGDLPTPCWSKWNFKTYSKGKGVNSKTGWSQVTGGTRRLNPPKKTPPNLRASRTNVEWPSIGAPSPSSVSATTGVGASLAAAPGCIGRVVEVEALFQY